MKSEQYNDLMRGMKADRIHRQAAITHIRAQVEAKDFQMAWQAYYQLPEEQTWLADEIRRAEDADLADRLAEPEDPLWLKVVFVVAMLGLFVWAFAVTQ